MPQAAIKSTGLSRWGRPFQALTVEVRKPQPMLRFYPHRQAKLMRLEPYREAWHLLAPPTNAASPKPNRPVSLYANADPHYAN